MSELSLKEAAEAVADLFEGNPETFTMNRYYGTAGVGISEAAKFRAPYTAIASSPEYVNNKRPPARRRDAPPGGGMKPLVYLAGGIAGLTGAEMLDWREEAARVLTLRGVETLNPMRAKQALVADGKRLGHDFRAYEQRGAFFTSKGIMTRDSTDVRRADALLVNLLGLTKPSLGTVMELGWAFMLNKPVVVAIEKEGNPHDGHPMIHETMTFRVETLEEAIDSVAVILNR